MKKFEKKLKNICAQLLTQMPVAELYLLLFRAEQIVFWRPNTNNKFQPMGCHMFQNNKCDFESRSLSCGQLKMANSGKL